MNNRRDFDRTHQNAPPTIAAPMAPTQRHQPAARAQQTPSRGGTGRAYSPYDEQPTEIHWEQRPQYDTQPPVAQPVAASAPFYRRPVVVFGAAAVLAVAALGVLLATWMSKDSMSTTPINTTGTPSQQVPLVPAPPPSQPVVQKPAPGQQAPQYVPGQQAPAPRAAPSAPSAVSPSPAASNSPVPEPNTGQPPQQQNPVQEQPLPEGQQGQAGQQGQQAQQWSGRSTATGGEEGSRQPVPGERDTGRHPVPSDAGALLGQSLRKKTLEQR